MTYYIVFIIKVLLCALFCSVLFYALSIIRGINLDFYWFITRFTPILAVIILLAIWHRQQK